MKFESSDWFLLGQDFAIKAMYFLFSKAAKVEALVSYNKVLTNLQSWSA